MKVNSFIVIELETDNYDRPKTGKMRITKNKPYIGSREIAFEIALSIPDTLFTRLVPVVNIDLPVDVLANPDPEIVTSITSQAVAEALKLDVQMVHDGLVEMIKNKGDQNV